MTIREMHYDFHIKRDSVASATKLNFLDSEVDWLLNMATTKVVKSRLGNRNASGDGLEASQKRTDDLKSLLIKYPEQPELIPTVHDGLLEVPLTSLKYEYLYFVRGAAGLSDCDKYIALTFVQHDDLDDHLSSPFSEKVAYNFGRSSSSVGSSLYMYPLPGQSIGTLRVEYLKTPARLSLGTYTYLDGITYPEQSSDLDAIIHDEIVDKAVSLSSDESTLAQLHMMRDRDNE